MVRDILEATQLFELMQEGHEVVIVDNFYNSKPEALDNITKITGKRPAFYEVELL